MYLQENHDGILFKVRLTPKAGREGLEGLHGDSLKVKVKAPPVDGKANKALIKLLAKHFGIPAGRVSLISGLTSRQKLVKVEGLSKESFLNLLDLDGT